MITAVDTNVLFEVFNNDPRHADMSSRALKNALSEGLLVLCDVVWAELAAAFPSQSAMEEKMNDLGVAFSPMGKESATLAGTMWCEYKAAGGARDRVVADFLVASHALVQCNRLLSRDKGFLRRYFRGISLLIPGDS